MNERIKELSKQAKEYAINRLDETGELHKYYDVYFEKFAELIVREMLDIFDKRAEPGTGFYEPQEPAEMIREHFGVEE